MDKNCIIALIIGSVLLAYKSLPPQPQASAYIIEFEGTPGTKILGSYGWTDLTQKTPMHSDKVNTTLPYKVMLTPPPGAVVNAYAMPLEQGSVTIKILKNGDECGQPIISGSTYMANMICEP